MTNTLVNSILKHAAQCLLHHSVARTKQVRCTAHADRWCGKI